MVKIEMKECKGLNNVLYKNSAFIYSEYNSDLVEFLKNLNTRKYHADDKSWEIPIELVATLCNKFLDISIEIEDNRISNVEEFNVEIPPNFCFKTKPFNHQLSGVKYALNKKKFLLGDEQGLGKTKQMIDWSNCLKQQGKIKRTLIICGVNSLKYNWLNEIKTHSDESAWVLGTRFRKNGNQYEGSGKEKLEDLNNLSNHSYLITNIESIRGLGTKKGNKYVFPIAEKIKELCENEEIGCIIIDEVHKCKNPTSQQGRSMIKIDNAKYMAALSGTPLMNNPLDLYFPLKWLGYESHSFYKFKQHYCNMGGFGGSSVVGYKNLDEIRLMLENVMLRRLKSEVLDLPEKIYTDEYVEMNNKQEKIYKSVLNDVRENIDKIKHSDNPLSMLIRLRQATGATSIVSSDVDESAKMDRMEQIIEELVESDQKCIVFSNWEQVTLKAKEKLLKYNPAYITGGVNADERMKEVNRFQNDKHCKVIIGTMGAMGTGLTLTAAQTVIFLDEPWNRALKDQCEDRAHRIGTTGTFNIITLLTKHTIDEKINNFVFKNGKLSDMLVDGRGGKIDMKIINELIS